MDPWCCVVLRCSLTHAHPRTCPNLLISNYLNLIFFAAQDWTDAVGLAILILIRVPWYSHNGGSIRLKKSTIAQIVDHFPFSITTLCLLLYNVRLG
jgi:hypothetical protein